MLKRITTLKPKKLVNENKRFASLMHSQSSDHAKRRVLAIYRTLLKEIPWIKDVYQVTTSERKMRDRIKREFLQHKDVVDLSIIDNLIFTAVEQIEDTKVRHSQRGHVLRWFEEEAPQDPFVKGFLKDAMGLPDDFDFGPKKLEIEQ